MIQAIRRKVLAGEYEFSKHAVDQSIWRKITLNEIGKRLPVAKSLKIILTTNMDRVA